MRIISGYDSSKVVEEAQKEIRKINKRIFGDEGSNIQYQMINIDGKPFYSVLIY